MTALPGASSIAARGGAAAVVAPVRAAARQIGGDDAGNINGCVAVLSAFVDHLPVAVALHFPVNRIRVASSGTKSTQE